MEPCASPSSGETMSAAKVMVNMRKPHSATTATAILGALIPVALAAQDKPPRSLARLGLPDDPATVPHLVATRNLPIFHLFQVGCPADGGWVAAAFAALEDAAETDTIVLKRLEAALGARILSRELCPADLPRFDAWLADELRRERSDGMLAEYDPEKNMRPFALLTFLSFSPETATQALVRDVAMDPAVAGYWRERAARAMIDQRYGKDPPGTDRASDPRYLDVVRSVLFDLASGPPLPEFEGPMAAWLRTTLGRSFEREYERLLRDAGRTGRRGASPARAPGRADHSSRNTSRWGSATVTSGPSGPMYTLISVRIPTSSGM